MNLGFWVSPKNPFAGKLQLFRRTTAWSARYLDPGFQSQGPSFVVSSWYHFVYTGITACICMPHHFYIVFFLYNWSSYLQLRPHHSQFAWICQFVGRFGLGLGFWGERSEARQKWVAARGRPGQTPNDSGAISETTNNQKKPTQFFLGTANTAKKHVELKKTVINQVPCWLSPGEPSTSWFTGGLNG